MFELVLKKVLSMQENIKHGIYDDEIDLQELLLTLWNKRAFIAIITSAVTLLALAYAFIKTPIYEARALIELGEYKLDSQTIIPIDDANALEKKLTTLFIDMQKNTQDKRSQITSITIPKGLKNFIEVKSEATSNNEAKDEIAAIIAHIQAKHSNILDDIKKQKELQLKNIDSAISDIKTKSIPLIDEKIQNNTKILQDLEQQRLSLDEKLKKIDTSNQSLVVLRVLEKRDIATSINNLVEQNFELENKKNNLYTSLHNLEETRQSTELLLLPYNYKNTQLVGEITTNNSPIKPKKSLIVAVAFVSGFILSIFLVFFIQFIKSPKEETN